MFYKRKICGILYYSFRTQKNQNFPIALKYATVKVEAAKLFGNELTYENLKIMKKDLSSRNHSLVFHQGNCYFRAFSLMIYIIF